MSTASISRITIFTNYQEVRLIEVPLYFTFVHSPHIEYTYSETAELYILSIFFKIIPNLTFTPVLR